MNATKFYHFTIIFLSILMIAAATLGHFPALFGSGQNGAFSKETQSLLKEMNQHLETARKIMIARNDQLLFVDDNNVLQEYCFEYGALWHNDYPLIKNLDSFSFEFRDVVGNRMNVTHQISELKSIGYTLGFQSNHKPCATYYQVPVKQIISTVAYHETSSIASMVTLLQ